MTDGDGVSRYAPGGVSMRPLHHFGKWTDENYMESFIDTNPVASAQARALWERMWDQFNQSNEGTPERRSSKHHARCSCTSLDGVEDDLLAVWPDGDEFCGTAALIELLIDAFPEVWSAQSCYGRDLTPQRLGRHLAVQCGVLSRRNSDKLRGYCRSDIEAIA